MPVQRSDRAKSRLEPPAPHERAPLARAIALDSLDAARACGAVRRCVVVTSDAEIARAASGSGDLVVPDPGGGLAAAIAAGIRAARHRAGTIEAHDTGDTRHLDGAGTSLAVLLADVPALRPAELEVALECCRQAGHGFVPDQEGTGTVLLGATHGPLRPAFGEGSAARHERSGARRLTPDAPSLRRDVDTWDGLLEAATLGLGPRTRAILQAMTTPAR